MRSRSEENEQLCEQLKGEKAVLQNQISALQSEKQQLQGSVAQQQEQLSETKQQVEYCLNALEEASIMRLQGTWSGAKLLSLEF